MSKVIEYKNSNYFCNKCRIMHKGKDGYLFNGQAYCVPQYKKIFPKFEVKETEK